MRRSEKLKLDRLLSGGQTLSPLEKERMLTHLLGPSEHTASRKYQWRIPAWVGATAAAAAAVVLVLYTAAPFGEHSSEHEGFQARGARLNRVSIRCVDRKTGDEGACANGRMLVFDIDPPRTAAFFSAAALASDGTLVRYFPSATEKSLPITKAGVITKGIEIGDSHRPGTYRVFGLFSKVPLEPDALRRILDDIVDNRPDKVDGVVAFEEAPMEVVER
jgi:hypothetical protein